jgi:anthranilate phosphoribosyltransferase
MRHAGAVRVGLGVPTAFNVLGPLTNPAQPGAAAIGVADARMAPIMAGVLAERGTSALLFRGEDGLDELSTTAPSTVWVVADGRVRLDRLDALDLDLPRADLADLVGGDPEHNADVVRSVLAGDKGAIRDAVLLNAAAGVVAADGAGSGALVDRFAEALGEVAQAVDDGAAARVLDHWVAASAS